MSCSRMGCWLHQEQASSLYALGMLSYNELKVRLTAANVALVATGSFLALSLGAHPFTKPSLFAPVLPPSDEILPI